MLGISEVAQQVGCTPRTLRHYHEIGLLAPSRVNSSGYRYYDQTSLIRLQRIMLLRDLGMSLDQVKAVLDETADEVDALLEHAKVLTERIAQTTRQLESVERTIDALTNKKELPMTDLLDGFDHSQYREEIVQKWGEDAYEQSDSWWRGLSSEQKANFAERGRSLSDAWISAAESGTDPSAPAAQELADAHYHWVQQAHGSRHVTAEILTGLGEMYVADERFAANYGGQRGAQFVCDALAQYARDRLG